MKTLLIAAACALLLAACGKPEPAESVESLMSNPERLKEVRAQCKTDHDKVGTPYVTWPPKPRGGASWAAARRTPAPPAASASVPKD
jgi:putative hemolysin